MPKASEFVDQVLHLMVPLGAVRAKPMFGGFGIFLEDVMFGLITRAGVLFLRADQVSRGAYEARGLGPHGKMPYFQIPPTALEDSDEFVEWATEALAAAHRNPTKKRPSRKRG